MNLGGIVICAGLGGGGKRGCEMGSGDGHLSCRVCVRVCGCEGCVCVWYGGGGKREDER